MQRLGAGPAASPLWVVVSAYLRWFGPVWQTPTVPLAASRVDAISPCALRKPLDAVSQRKADEMKDLREQS